MTIGTRIGIRMEEDEDRDDDRDYDGESERDADGVAFCRFVRIVSLLIIVPIIVPILVEPSLSRSLSNVPAVRGREGNEDAYDQRGITRKSRKRHI